MPRFLSTIADPQTLEHLLGRLARLSPNSQRRWAAPGTLLQVHFRFGPMSVKDWQRWAWRHVDHHLRQFGL